MKKRVVAKIVGGVGNQLFCYAAARRLALKNSASLCLDLNFFRSDVNYGRAYRLDGFVLSPHDVVREGRLLPGRADLKAWRLKRRLAKHGLLPGRDWLVESTPGVFEPDVLHARVTRTTVMDGYWQDERYFADIEGVLRRELALRPEAGSGRPGLAARIASSNAVAVHCRRLHGATLTEPDRRTDALDAGYYLKAIEIVARNVPRPEFFCFGDNPSWLVDRWPSGLPLTVVHDAGPHGDLADLRLMTRCRHFIVANSTFSWWGAWLGEDPAKVVVAPRPKGMQYEVRSAAGWTEVDW
jgi:hypothetical protein